MSASILGVFPDYAKIQYTPITSDGGRFINEQDMLERRKVIVLAPRQAEVLFGSVNPVGQFVRFGGVTLRVIGVYKPQTQSNDAPAYIPFSTAQTLYADGNKIGELTFTISSDIDTEEEILAFENKFRATIARRHNFSPNDRTALGYYSSGEEFLMWRGLTNGIEFFIWIIGIGTLMAGIVGVSNIMLISVRERTREFGIRKALGAKPFGILQLVIIESIIVTAVFGYIGMVFGIGLSELINYIMEAANISASSDMGNAAGGITVFRNPTVNLGIAFSATAVLIIAGVLAGYFPARKAVGIPAIEAIREE
jgi:putative ABC transport system permease protein